MLASRTMLRGFVRTIALTLLAAGGCVAPAAAGSGDPFAACTLPHGSMVAHDHVFDHAHAGSEVAGPSGVTLHRHYPRDYLITRGQKTYVAWRRSIVNPVTGEDDEVYMGRRSTVDTDRAQRDLQAMIDFAPRTIGELVGRGYWPVHHGAHHWINPGIRDQDEGVLHPRMYMMRGGTVLSAVYVSHAGMLPDFGLGGWHHHGYHNKFHGRNWMMHVWLTPRLDDAYSDGYFVAPAQHDDRARRCSEQLASRKLIS